MDKTREAFFDRADAHISLSNTQSKTQAMSEVSASMLYGTARYNAFVFASNYQDTQDMHEDKSNAIEYFVGQYKMMLEENIEDYIKNFEQYIQAGRK